jgi:mono/diheme cytochrome c family protein
MNFPYDQRWLMAYWSWLFDSNERLQTDSSKSPEWNRGRYLVEALGHCGECHTERNFLQATSGSKALGGAITQNWKAYDITPDKSGIGDWTDAELVSYLSTGFAKDHGPASGPMAEAISNSLSHLPTEDIHAIVTYLRSVQPVASTVEVASAGAPTASATDAKLAYGRAVFARSCANCHKLDGSGTQSQYEALKGSETVSDPQATNLTQIVLDGSNLQLPSGHVQMLGFGKGLTDTDVAAVVNYVTQQLGGHSANLTPQDIATRR